MLLPTGSGGQPGLHNLGKLTSHTQSGLKDAAYKLSHNPLSGALAAGGAFFGNDLGNIGNYALHGDSAKFVDPIKAAISAYGQKASPLPSGGSGEGPMKTSMLAAFARHGGGAPASIAAPSAPSAHLSSGGDQGGGGGNGYGNPVGGDFISQLAGQLGELPQFSAPKGDFNSYLKQAQGALDFAGIDHPYQQAIGNVKSDTADSIANIIGAGKGAVSDIRGGDSVLQSSGQNSIANTNAVEGQLAAQQLAAAHATGATTDAAASALGLGSLSGQVGSSANAEAAAAQQVLAAAAQDANRATNQSTQSAIQGNSDYANAVNSAATLAQQSTSAAGRDAQTGISMQQGQADYAARAQAAQNAMTQQQNDWTNQLGSYNAQVGAWGSKANWLNNLIGDQNQYQANALTQRGQDMGYTVNEQNVQAQILGAENAAIGAQGSGQQSMLDWLKVNGKNYPDIAAAIIANTGNQDAARSQLFGNPAYLQDSGAPLGWLQNNPQALNAFQAYKPKTTKK